jgi:UDP-N-acetylglucosamine transferase subunit ALG13
MIFLTIGTQLPFDRLVNSMDEIAPRLDEKVFGQVGPAGFRPVNMEWSAMLDHDAFEERFGGASVIVSHAGIGTILAAQKFGKPLVIMPRLARFGEHRNDHQLATAEQVGRKRGIYVVSNADDLMATLMRTDLEAASEDFEMAGRAAFVGNLRAHIANFGL